MVCATRVVALDACTGKLLRDTRYADTSKGYGNRHRQPVSGGFIVVDMLGHVTGVNAITMASLNESPEILEELLPWNARVTPPCTYPPGTCHP